MKKYSLIVSLCVLFLAACANTAPQTFVDKDTSQHLLNDLPSQGYGRLFLFDGRIVKGTTESSMAAHFRADEFVDGKNVGSLNGGDVLIMDVPAGNHIITWMERSSKSPVSTPLTINLHSGQKLYISNDFLMDVNGSNAGAPFMAFGAVGGAIAGVINANSGENTNNGEYLTIRKNGEEMIQGYDVVLPNEAALKQIRKGK